MGSSPRSKAPGASLPSTHAVVSLAAIAGREVQVVIRPARRDQRTTSVVRGSRAAV
jgi:hypothetical protein